MQYTCTYNVRFSQIIRWNINQMLFDPLVTAIEVVGSYRRHAWNFRIVALKRTAGELEYFTRV